MTNPEHFDFDVPQRVHELICEIYDDPSKSKSKRFSRATFLLSMSMPILILPIERILRYIRKKNPTDHARKMKCALGKGVYNEKFFECLWQYASYEEQKNDEQKNLLNLAAKKLPEDIAKKLDLKEAKEDARKLPTCCFLSILRNALAHGGVFYLDKKGRSSPSAAVHSFAFVSEHSSNRKYGRHILRVRIDDYRGFLEKWVEWIEEEAIRGLLTKN